MDFLSSVYSCRSYVPATAWLLTGILVTHHLSAQGLSAQGLPVDLTTNTGITQAGQLIAVTATGIELEQSGEKVRIDSTELMSMELKSVEKRSPPSIRVLLVTGSQLSVDEVHTEGNELVVEPRRQASLRLPMKQVRAIRFRKPSDATDAAWLGMLETEIETQSRGDRMVIRRGSDRLDPTDGIINGIAEQKILFDLDGDPISAPIDRLEGVIFGGNDRDQQLPNVMLVDAYGSTWAASALLPSRLDQASADQGIQLQMAGNVNHTVPIGLVRMVRWSSGLFMLADAQPAKLNVQTEFGIDWKNDALGNWFGPQRLTAKKKSATQPSQDLILYGGCEVQYRIEKGFRLLSGSVRRSEEIKNGSGVSVRIKLDDQVVWDNQLPNADSLGFELELGDARRIKIEVDSGDDGDLGAIVHMVRPRLVK